MDEEDVRRLEDHLVGLPRLLAGRNVLVCGEADGLWRATAEWARAKGANVLLAARDTDALEAVVWDLGGIHPCLADLSTPEGRRKMIREVDAHFGGRDTHGAFLNPGEPRMGGFAPEISAGKWHADFDKTVVGPTRLLWDLTPRMPDGSSIVFAVSPLTCEPDLGNDPGSMLCPVLLNLISRMHEKLSPCLRVNGVMPPRRLHAAAPDEVAETALAACYLLSDAFLCGGTTMRPDKGFLSAVPPVS